MKGLFDMLLAIAWMAIAIIIAIVFFNLKSCEVKPQGGELYNNLTNRSSYYAESQN